MKDIQIIPSYEWNLNASPSSNLTVPSYPASIPTGNDTTRLNLTLLLGGLALVGIAGYFVWEEYRVRKKKTDIFNTPPIKQSTKINPWA